MHKSLFINNSSKNQNLHFSRFGALLILGRTNSFRTLVAEAFLRSAIEKKFTQGEFCALQNVVSLGQDVSSSSRGSSFSAPPVLHQPDQQQQQQLNPLIRDILTSSRFGFDSKISPTVLDSLWSKTTSAMTSKDGWRTFDAVVTITDGDKSHNNNDENSNFDQEEREDIDIEEEESNNADPFSLLPLSGGEGSQFPTSQQQQQPQQSSSWHFTDTAGVCSKREWKIYSPRDDEVRKKGSKKSFQDDLYIGEPQFSCPKRIPHFSPSTRQILWRIPDVKYLFSSTSSSSASSVAFTEDEKREQVVQVIRQIEELCDELIDIACAGGK